MGTLRCGAQGRERGRVQEGMRTPAHVSNTPPTTLSDKGPGARTHGAAPGLPTAGREAPAPGNTSTSDRGAGAGSEAHVPPDAGVSPDRPTPARRTPEAQTWLGAGNQAEATLGTGVPAEPGAWHPVSPTNATVRPQDRSAPRRPRATGPEHVQGGECTRCHVRSADYTQGLRGSTKKTGTSC